jgi:hypothetical protein
VSFFFLESDVADEIGVCDFPILGNVGFGNEKECARSFDLFGRGALLADAVFEKSPPFIGEAVLPDLGV